MGTGPSEHIAANPTIQQHTITTTKMTIRAPIVSCCFVCGWILTYILQKVFQFFFADVGDSDEKKLFWWFLVVFWGVVLNQDYVIHPMVARISCR